MSDALVPSGPVRDRSRRSKKKGRPTVLTFRVMLCVVRHLNRGTTLEYACHNAGVSTDAWEKRASRDSRFSGMTTRARLRGKRVSIEAVTDRMRDIALDPNAKDRVQAGRVFLAHQQGTLTRLEGGLAVTPQITSKDLERILADPEKTKNLHERLADAIAEDRPADGEANPGFVGPVREQPNLEPTASP